MYSRFDCSLDAFIILLSLIINKLQNVPIVTSYWQCVCNSSHEYYSHSNIDELQILNPCKNVIDFINRLNLHDKLLPEVCWKHHEILTSWSTNSTLQSSSSHLTFLSCNPAQTWKYTGREAKVVATTPNTTAANFSLCLTCLLFQSFPVCAAQYRLQGGNVPWFVCWFWHW